MKKKSLKIGYLGTGTWGIALACILASNKHKVTMWGRSVEHVAGLKETRMHPKLPGFKAPSSIVFTHNLAEAVEDADVIIESVTSAGMRAVFADVYAIRKKMCPVVITSKGIEQNTGLLLPEVVLEILGDENKKNIGCLSGPSHAEEVIKNLPTSIVSSSYETSCAVLIKEIFTTPTFRIYPNLDIQGVSFGAAMKNIIAIACGISDGLGFGDNTKAALMTRGLHEIRKLSVTKNANPETLNGLSGLGDLCVTCLSTLSRNYRFGNLIAEGLSPIEAKNMIGMVVEGMYTCVSALQLGKKHQIAVPITEVTHAIIYQGMNPKDAVNALLTRAIKEEHL